MSSDDDLGPREALHILTRLEAMKFGAMVYSVGAAAWASSLSERQIRKAIATGELRSVVKGRRRLIFARDLEAYLRSELAPVDEEE